MLSSPAQEGQSALVDQIEQLAKRARNDCQARQLASLRADPKSAYKYISAVEDAYNSGDRTMAVQLLDLGIKAADEKQLVLRAQRALFRFEHDLPALEKSYSEELDEGIASGREYLPPAVISDAVVLKRLLPRYAKLYEEHPEYVGLFGFLKSAYTKLDQMEALTSLYAQRLKSIPQDGIAADAYVQLLRKRKRHELLADTPNDLPQAIRDLSNFPLYRMEALIALGREEAALQIARQMHGEAGHIPWDWKYLAELCAQAGSPKQALAVTRKFAPPGDHNAALAYAKYGDMQAALKCVQQVIDRKAPAWVIFECVDACRLAGQPARAEEVFTLAEQVCLKELADSKEARLEVPYQISYRYGVENREERYFETFAPMLTKKESERTAFLLSIAEALQEKKDHKRAKALLHSQLRAKPDDCGNLLRYAAILEKLDQFQSALQIYSEAEAKCAMEHDDLGLSDHGDPVLARYNFYLRVKDYKACEAWLKDKTASALDKSALRLLANLYKEQKLTDKAVETYRMADDHNGALHLLLEESRRDEAIEYIRALPDPACRKSLERSWNLEKQDTAWLINQAQKEVQQSPDKGSKHAELGILLFQNNQPQEGRAEIQQALRLGYDFGLVGRFRVLPSCLVWMDSNVHYGQVLEAYLNAGMLKELGSDFETILSMTTAHRSSHLQSLARYYTERNRVTEAAAVYRHLLELDPYYAGQWSKQLKELEGK